MISTVSISDIIFMIKVHERIVAITHRIKGVNFNDVKRKKVRGLSPRANYTD
jgi:hypothetical protein